ncbi:MAG: glycosyltransferase family 4 protein [Methanomicrobiales archaeon]|nr:glycosyltransferase family 4 protein [Methanomicrobiales archaeon]
MSRKKVKIGIYTAITEKASIPPISNLVEILEPISKFITLITGNAAYDFFKSVDKIKTFNNSHPINNRTIIKIYYYLRSQIRGLIRILLLRDKIDIWLFFMGGEREILPILTAKILKKPTLLILTGSIINSAKYSRDPFYLMIKILNAISCWLVDGIILYSSRLATECKLEKYQHKIYIAQRHFIDLNQFFEHNNYERRPNVIGYIGRLSEEKGILNFVDALEMIHTANSDVNFFIGGDGPLRDQIITSINRSGLNTKVTFVGWIPHCDLPKYLNKLKILIIPSFTEGLPNILLEAMACGTPVLITPVGAVPEIVKDGLNGFILDDNSKENIANNVIRVLNHQEINKITQNAKNIVKNEFNQTIATLDYTRIIHTLINSRKKTDDFEN